MIAAAGAGVPAIGHELVSAKPDLPRVFIKADGCIDCITPAFRGMDVHLDHAGIRRYLDDIDARIQRRRIALYMDGNAGRLCAGLHACQQLKIILELFHRRHEHANHAIARLHGQSRAHRPLNDFLLHAVLPRRRIGDHCLKRLRRMRCRSLGHGGCIRQGAARLQRVLLHNIGIGGGRHPRQRGKRQAVANGRIARHKKQLLTPQPPFLAHPSACGGRVPALHGKDIAGRL